MVTGISRHGNRARRRRSTTGLPTPVASATRVMGLSSQLGARYPPAYALDDGCVVEVERQTLQVTEGKAPLKEQLVSDEVATYTYFGVLETGDSTGVMRLAEVESEEVFGADYAWPVEGLDGSEPLRRIIKIMVGCHI